MSRRTTQGAVGTDSPLRSLRPPGGRACLGNAGAKRSAGRVGEQSLWGWAGENDDYPKNPASNPDSFYDRAPFWVFGFPQRFSNSLVCLISLT